MVVFLGIRPGQVPEEPQPEGLDPFRDWQYEKLALEKLSLFMAPVSGKCVMGISLNLCKKLTRHLTQQSIISSPPDMTEQQCRQAQNIACTN